MEIWGAPGFLGDPQTQGGALNSLESGTAWSRSLPLWLGARGNWKLLFTSFPLGLGEAAVSAWPEGGAGYLILLPTTDDLHSVTHSFIHTVSLGT